MTQKISLEEVKEKMMQEWGACMTIVERDYPRIFTMITNGWGTRALHEAFVRMLVTDQDGRQGFPAPAGLALMRIHLIHQFMFDFQEFRLVDKDEFNRVKRDSW